MHDTINIFINVGKSNIPLKDSLTRSKKYVVGNANEIIDNGSGNIFGGNTTPENRNSMPEVYSLKENCSLLVNRFIDTSIIPIIENTITPTNITNIRIV